MTLDIPKKSKKELETEHNKLHYTTFGAGCFWCVEAIFTQLKGVASVTSGYSGGKVVNPTYRQVSTGTTGHAEVIRIGYNPTIISFKELLEIFWKTHDPTVLNKQGNDIGTQYRSAIFYHNEEQQKLAEYYKKELDASTIFSSPILTRITPLTNYYEVEDYHKNYYERNSSQNYCQFVIAPKVKKFQQVFKKKLKE